MASLRQLLEQLGSWTEVPEMVETRISKWLSGEIDPPRMDLLSDAELSDVLRLIVQDWEWNDRRAICIYEAAQRLCSTENSVAVENGK